MHTISRRARPHTITLYNYTGTTAGVAAYQRTVIERVLLDLSYQQRLAQRGISTTDTAQLIIDLQDIITTGNRMFKEAEAWKALTDKTGFFTFQAPNDFFLDGASTQELPPVTKATMIAGARCLAVSQVAVPASGQNGPLVLEVTAK